MKSAIRIIALTVGCLAISAVVAQDAPKVPTITDAHKYAFAKAHDQLTQIQSALQQAQVKLNSAVADMSKDCGDDFQPQMDPVGDPVCVAKPKPKPEVKK